MRERLSTRTAVLAVIAFVLMLAVVSAGGESTRTNNQKQESAKAQTSAPAADDVLAGLRQFYRATARADGSFQPGIDPDYIGMSDCAASDLAAVTYAVTIHKTFGWQLPHEAKSIAFLLSRQRKDGSFFNVGGTYDPNSAEARCYNTTQGLVALHALGIKPRFNPLPVFDELLKRDYKTLPPYATSFFPLAYLCAGKSIPEKADRAIRALMVQDETGYFNDHIAATFHASHYYNLVGEATPKSEAMVARILRDQKRDGGWLLNMPSRDRHAAFDGVFTLVHEGHGRADCRAAIQRAARWALSCRNPDGGFGHFPGSTSDADAIYFQVGTLVMAGFLPPVNPLPKDPHLLSWGHLMPVADSRQNGARFALKVPGWASSVAFSPNGSRVAVGSADKLARVFDAISARELSMLQGHQDYVASVCFDPESKRLATGSYDHTAAIWDVRSSKIQHKLVGHGGAVLSVAFSPDNAALATGSVDGTIKLWDVATGRNTATLSGHRSWVNSVAYRADGSWLVSGSSDGTVRVWSGASQKLVQSLAAGKAEVRCIAVSADGKQIAAGLRYGTVKVWDTSDWQVRYVLKAHEGDAWSVAFSPDAKLLASGGGDWNRGGLVKLWQLSDSKPLARFQHTGEVLSVAFSPDGKSLAAGAGDGTVKVWDLAAGKH